MPSHGKYKSKKQCPEMKADGTRCKYSTWWSGDMSNHKKSYHSDIEFSCGKCDFKTTNAATFKDHKHQQCRSCSKKFISGARFREHVKKHPTSGKIYSLALEQVFKGNQAVLAKGRRMAQQVENKFGKSTSDHDSHFHIYMIMFPFDTMPQLVKEFVDGDWYIGHGGETRHRGHQFSIEPNPVLREFYKLCHGAGVNPFYFKPFNDLTAIQASIIESAILKAIDLHNLANENYGNSMPQVFAHWSMDDLATLGAYYLHEAYQLFKSTSLDVHNHLVLRKSETTGEASDESDSTVDEASKSSNVQIVCTMSAEAGLELLKQLQGMRGQVNFVTKAGKLSIEPVAENSDFELKAPPNKRRKQ